MPKKMEAEGQSHSCSPPFPLGYPPFPLGYPRGVGFTPTDEDPLGFGHPRGVRFTPTDQELIMYYLIPKVRGQKLPCDFFIEDNLYSYHPQQLIEKYRKNVEGVSYIFTPRIRKYANGSRPNRSAGTGYWKATGSDQQILNRKNMKIGYKKSLAYHEGKQPEGEKTGWIMQEYRINDTQKPIDHRHKSMVLDDFVLCKIYYREITHPRDSKKMQISPMDQSSQPNFDALEIPLDIQFYPDENGMYEDMMIL